MRNVRKAVLVMLAGLVLLLTGCCMFSAAPTVDFSWSPSDPTSHATVQFTDRSTGTNLRSWSWDFGDGNSSGSQNPSHTYTTGGNHQVRLTVTDACGKVNTAQKTVSVETSLTGTWSGYFRDGIDIDLRIQLSQSGQNVNGEVFFLGLRLSGSGTFINGRLRFSFRLPGDPFNIVLTGDYNPARDAISGSWQYMEITWDTWEVVRQ